MVKMVIDPGHGGEHTGAKGPSGLLEKDVNLELAFYLARYLKDKGFEVFLTRESDETVSLAQRVEFIEQIKPCLVISLHHNACEPLDPNINRMEIYVPFEFEGPYVELGAEIGEAFQREMGRPFKGVLPANYTILKAYPFSMLIEMSYITNPDEEARLRDSTYIKKNAILLGKVLWAFLEKGCDFNFHLKTITLKKARVRIPKRGLSRIGVSIDGKLWEHYSVKENTIEILLPFDWREIEVVGADPYGYRYFPLKVKNPEFLPIKSFSHSVQEFGNLKLVEVRLYDAMGNAIDPGLPVKVEARGGEVVMGSPRVEKGGKVYFVLKSEHPEPSIRLSIKGFEGRVFVKSVEDLRSGEIAGIVRWRSIPIEGVKIVNDEGKYTFTSKLGVFKIEAGKKLVFTKNGFYTRELEGVEGGQNVQVELDALMPPLLGRKILLVPEFKGRFEDQVLYDFIGVFETFAKFFGIEILLPRYPYPGFYHSIETVKQSLELGQELIIKVEAARNEFYFSYYYLDERGLDALRRISVYFVKQGLKPIDIRESSDYLLIQARTPRFAINIPYDSAFYSLYSYLILLGLAHYFGNEPVILEELSAEKVMVDDGFTIPGVNCLTLLPKEFLKRFKIEEKEGRCTDLQDGN